MACCSRLKIIVSGRIEILQSFLQVITHRELLRGGLKALPGFIFTQVILPEVPPEEGPVAFAIQDDVQDLMTSSVRSVVLDDGPTLTTYQNPRIARLFRVPNFPQTAEDAADLLTIARLSSDERSHRRSAVEDAVKQGVRELQALMRQNSSTPIITECLEEIATLKNELVTASTELGVAEEEIGVVRSLICQKALPLHFEFSPSGDPEYQSSSENIVRSEDTSHDSNLGD